MKIDLHVHTNRYSACGRSSPGEMVAAAIRAGLDGIVLTEHGVYWPSREMEELRGKHPDLVILGGIEVSTPEGDVLVYGSEERALADDLWTMPRLFGPALNGDTFRVVAHPFRFDDSREHFEFLSRLPLEAVEVASTNTDARAGRMANELSEAGGFRRVAASDAHQADRVGRYHTIFEDEIRSEEDLVRALRSGRFRPSHVEVV